MVVTGGRDDLLYQIDLLLVQLWMNGFDATKVKEQPVLIDTDASVCEASEHRAPEKYAGQRINDRQQPEAFPSL
jgi:hypothetical protein